MKEHFSIAIDGPGGAGKSTLAKAVAKKLNILHVDTGAIYRTIGYAAFSRGLDAKDEAQIAPLLKEIQIDMAFDETGGQKMLLDGKDVSTEIRLPEISMYASNVSALPCVRAYLLEMQRDIARRRSVIMDGRDIGTVVLPDADLKIYLTASAEERARRRCLELSERGTPKAYEEVLREINERDYQDMHRDIAPLREAADAVHFDTSKLSFEESEQALWIYRVDVKGLENLPKHSVLLCPNHSTDLDPVLIGLCLPLDYHLHFMAKAELFDNRALAWLIRTLGAFPVQRDGKDIQSIKTAMQVLHKGENLLIFPEGTTIRGGVGYHDGLPAHAHAGIAMIGVRTGATLVPVFCDGQKKPFRKTRIIFGEPYVPEVTGRRGTSEELQAIADEMLRQAYALGGQQVGGAPL